jgi:hypothetical protein
MTKLSARSKHRKLAAGKPTKAGTTPADRRVLAQAAAEDESRPTALSVGAARKKLRLACEQIGFALAGARLQEDFDTVDSLTPVLASVWSARMELGDVPEVTP